MYVLRTETRPGIWTDWVIIYVGQQDVENTDVYLSLPQSVSGVVRDAQTGEPVAGADIRVSTDEGRNGDGMETDAEG